jgi:regulatory protein
VSVGLRLLARRGRFEEELEGLLRDRGFDRAAVRAALGRLRELGYIDDPKLAADRSELLQQRGYGAGRIRHDLERRGADPAIVERVLPGPERERLIARRALGKRFRNGTPADPRERARAARSLAARGFHPETVEWALGTWDDGESYEG